MTPRRIAIVFAGLVVLWLIYHALFKWGLENSHRRFLSAIEDKDWPEVGRLVSDQYSDRYNFDEKKLSAAIRDVANQFILSMTIDWKEVEKRKADNGTILSGHLSLSGSGSPIAEQIIREASRFENQRVEFQWKKESAWPWSWRLQSIDLPGLDLPRGYIPGSFGLDYLDF